MIQRAKGSDLIVLKININRLNPGYHVQPAAAAERPFPDRYRSFGRVRPADRALMAISGYAIHFKSGL